MSAVDALKKWLESFPRLRKRLESIHKKVLWQVHLLSDWWHTYMAKSIVQMNTSRGFTLATRNYRANRLMLDGTFESEEMSILTSYLQECDVFVDIGANIGLYSCLACSIGKPCIAIEPQPRNVTLLCKNLKDNGFQHRCEVYPVALSDQPGVMPLYGASGPSASFVSGWAGYSSRFKQEVIVNTLDNVLGQRFVGKRLLIKMDVEGAEYGVLLGGNRTIHAIPSPVWLIEICLSEFHPSGINPHFLDTFELFWSAGYVARTADAHSLEITRETAQRWVALKRSEASTFNYLFLTSL